MLSPANILSYTVVVLYSNDNCTFLISKLLFICWTQESQEIDINSYKRLLEGKFAWIITNCQVDLLISYFSWLKFSRRILFLRIFPHD